MAKTKFPASQGVFLEFDTVDAMGDVFRPSAVPVGASRVTVTLEPDIREWAIGAKPAGEVVRDNPGLASLSADTEAQGLALGISGSDHDAVQVFSSFLASAGRAPEIRTEPVIVAFLQNQWFRNPEGAKAMLARYPDSREKILRRFLFAGCRTGQRLKIAFGEDLCRSIIWEECSTEIGGVSESNFAPDPAHICAVLEKHRPDIVLCFGVNARTAVPKLWEGKPLFFPHPAARTVTMVQMKAWRVQLDAALSRVTI